MSERILVTGATGRVGARFLPLLRRDGAEIRVLLWMPAPSRPAGGSVVMGDLCDVDTCRRAVQGIDAVVHMASAFQGVTAHQATDVNFRATEQLAAAALEAGVRRFVQMSSYLVYGPSLDRPAREDDEPRPHPDAPFPAAKLGSERALRRFIGTALETCVLRVAFTYGEGDPHLADAFIWARQQRAGRRLHLVHHTDVRQGIRLALREPAAGHRTYNLADDTPATAGELLDLAPHFRATGPPVAPDELTSGADQFGGVVDGAAARRDLGFRPTFPSIQAAREAGAM
jgi:nucleoside-diphosphate-sugar epimerase